MPTSGPIAKPPHSETVDELTYLKDEQAAIAAIRASRLGLAAGASNALPWAGIGLSGGGIRSASLSLGALQALAEHDLLKRFDYISSVSGGGYVAGALQWWWQRSARDERKGKQPFGFGPRDFPYGPARIATTPETGEALHEGRANLGYLRSHSAYLIPGDGITTWSMLAVVLRTIVISLFTWIMLLTGAFVVLHIVDDGIAACTLGSGCPNWLPQVVAETLARAHNLLPPLPPELIPPRWQTPAQIQDCVFGYRIVYALLLWLVFAAVTLFCVAAIMFAFVSRVSLQSRPFLTVPFFLLVAGGASFVLWSAWAQFGVFDDSMIIAVCVALQVLIVALTIVFSEIFTPRELNASYWLRRKLEILLGWTFVPILFILLLALVPLPPYYLATASSAGKITIAGILGLLSGIVSSLYSYYAFIRNLSPSLAVQIVTTLCSIAFLYVAAVIAYCLSLAWAGQIVLPPDVPVPLSSLLSALFAVALILALVANINYVGLHRFYRDRLMEAFMPSDRAVREGKSLSSALADTLSVDTLVGADGLHAAPYPLINTNVILVNDVGRYKARGGDNFVISPLFVGSSATGWQNTRAYSTHKAPMSLASAIAASGAAATASAGYIGTGPTMNPLVAAVMSVLNIRLGLWVPNPASRRLGLMRIIPTFLHPGLTSGVLARRHSRHSRFLELTDGGHFENLGLYELARRRLPLILIIDGEADPNISLSSLVSATRRIEQDFDITLRFYKGFGPESLIMQEAKGYPSGVRYAEAPFMLGELRYGERERGLLIYLKSTLIKTMDFTTAGYLANNPKFPHEPTINQFFTADQFDAYRYLGYEAAKLMISRLDLCRNLYRPDFIETATRTYQL